MLLSADTIHKEEAPGEQRSQGVFSMSPRGWQGFGLGRQISEKFFAEIKKPVGATVKYSSLHHSEHWIVIRAKVFRRRSAWKHRHPHLSQNWIFHSESSSLWVQLILFLPSML